MTDDDLSAIEARVTPYLHMDHPWDYMHEDEAQLICGDIPALIAEVRRLQQCLDEDRRVLRLKRPRKPAGVTA